MATVAGKPLVSYADYLALEEKAETRHEWLDGTLYGMSGGTPSHARIATNFAGELRSALKGRPCTTYNSDLRIRVLATGLATYPDVTVICGQLESDPQDKNGAVNPVLLVEVLSDSTEAYDRSEKFAHCRRIPSLREYVLVSQHEERVEVYRRNANDTWILEEFRSGMVKLCSVTCEISVTEIYADPLATVHA